MLITLIISSFITCLATISTFAITPPPTIQAVVLAAGKSTRFKTKKSKLLHTICGRPMILYPLKELEKLAIPTTLVLGHQAEDVQNVIEAANLPSLSFVIQQEQKGTGHAVACSRATWHADTILILYGDTPLITADLLSNLIAHHQSADATISFCSTQAPNPQGYGRVVETDRKLAIVEEVDCSPEQRLITTVNAGIYAIQRTFLERYLDLLSTDNQKKEFYLTDLVGLASQQELGVEHYDVPFDAVRGINTLQELSSIERIKRSEHINNLMANGVYFEHPESVCIDLDVKVGANSYIGMGVHLLGNTKIGQESIVGSFSSLTNASIDDYITIYDHSIINNSHIASHAYIGPFAHIHHGALIGNYSHIGNFVEIDTTSVGNYVKAKHLTYLGHANVGNKINIGAGTITCNYDGKNKNRTTIEDNTFIGSNNTLVAPLTIQQGSFTAAGSTITQDVPEKSFAIGRSRQTNKIGYIPKSIRAKIN